MKAKDIKKKPHFKLVKFYARAQQPVFLTEAAARRRIHAMAIERKAEFYVQLWKMTDEENGEMVSHWDNSEVELREID